MKRGIVEAHRYGVTSIQEAGVSLEDFTLFDALQLAGALPLRAYANHASTGNPEMTAAEMARIVAMMDARGWQIEIHAIGDRGIRMALDAFAAAEAKNPARARGRRHRLEHIEDVSAADIPRFAKLDVIESTQPYHASPNQNVLEVWAANVGPERAARAWAWKTIHDAGRRLAFGTDWPVVGIDPRPGIHTALTRQTMAGLPAGGFNPEQRLPLATVLESYTTGSAYAGFDEGRVGQLKVGMLADVVIWSRDIFAMPAESVKNAAVATTIFDGCVVYQRP